MAKQFAFICFGVLCLAVAYHLGARSAMADWVGPGSGNVAGVVSRSGGFVAWSVTGEAWTIDQRGWERDLELYDLPVPASEVKVIAGGHSGGLVLITVDDRAYDHGGSIGWIDVGQYPGSPVGLEGGSWGSLKDRLGRNAGR